MTADVDPLTELGSLTMTTQTLRRVAGDNLRSLIFEFWKGRKQVAPRELGFRFFWGADC